MIANSSFKLWYTKKSKTRNRVNIVVDNSLKDKVIKVAQKRDKIIAFKTMVEK